MFGSKENSAFYKSWKLPRFSIILEPVEITIESRIEAPIKEPERAKLVGGLIDAFKQCKVELAEVSEWYYIDRRSAISPDEGTTNIAIAVKTGATSIELAQFLDLLVQGGKKSKRNVIARIGSIPLVDDEGNIMPDEEIIRLIYEARREIEAAKARKTAARKALVFGTAIYSPWGNAPMPVIVTLFSQEAIRRAASGHAGLSPIVRVKWFSCSICNENYAFCDHEVGQKYEENARPCIAIPRDIEFLENSIVEFSVDSNKITDLLVIEDNNRYEWYGFKNASVFDRLSNIRSVRKDNLIPDAASNKFRHYFSNRSIGRCKFRKGEEKRSIGEQQRKSTGASRRKTR